MEQQLLQWSSTTGSHRSLGHCRLHRGRHQSWKSGISQRALHVSSPCRRKTSFSTESHDQVVSESVPPNRTVQTCKEHLVDNAVYVFSADHTMLVTPSRLTPSRFSRIIFDSLEDFEREFDMTDFTSSSRWQGAVCCKHSESRVCGAMA